MSIGVVTHVYRQLRSGGSAGRCATFVATAHLKDVGRELPVFFKVFDTNERDKANFNELFGYFVAKACRLPVPEATFLCACESQRLSGYKVTALDSTHSGFLSGIASVDSKPHGVKQFLQGSTLRVGDILNWSRVAEVAVFDELLFNTDRTCHNLVRIGEHDYVLIDHEQIFDGPRWTLDTLPALLTRPSHKNILAALIGETTDEITKRRMLKIAQEYIGRTTLSAKMLDINIESVCHLPNGSVEYIIELINKRMKLLPELMFEYVKMGQMFNERT